MKLVYKWTFCLGHSFVLIAISFLWMNTPYSYGDEEFIIKWSSHIKRFVFNIDEDPSKKDFIFINLAYEKELIPFEDKLGTEVITDREILAKFFKIVKKHPNEVKFTICDVFLKGKSKNDSLLISTINGIPNLVFPCQTDNNNNTIKPDLQVPYAIADYKSSNNNFIKFKLIQNDTIASLPVYMYSKLENRTIKSNNIFCSEQGKPCFNSVIIDFQINTNELFDQKEYPVVNLSELMILPEEIIINDFLSGKIVILGDLNGDVHKTVFGQMPGSLILLNVYLTLLKGYHYISWQWFLYLYLSLTLFSAEMLFNQKEEIKRKNKWLKSILISTTFLMIISFGSYLFFNISVQVLVLVVYINLIIYLKGFYVEKLKMYKFTQWPKQIFNHTKLNIIEKIKSKLNIQ